LSTFVERFARAPWDNWRRPPGEQSAANVLNRHSRPSGRAGDAPDALIAHVPEPVATAGPAYTTVNYLSTRDARRMPATYSFEDVLLAGLAEDGGLFVPDSVPKLDAAALRGLAGLPYAELAARVIALFTGGSFSPAELQQLTNAAYGTFSHAAVAPLVQLDERLWLLELFHGPTLAFKDLALQLIGRLFDAVLARRHQHVTIIGATSGDTGSAARSLPAATARALDIFMLYPHGRIPRCSAGK
jgi:threonine synthase